MLPNEISHSLIKLKLKLHCKNTGHLVPETLMHSFCFMKKLIIWASLTTTAIPYGFKLCFELKDWSSQLIQILHDGKSELMMIIFHMKLSIGMKFCVKSKGSSMDNERRGTYFYCSDFVLQKSGVFLNELHSIDLRTGKIRNNLGADLSNTRTRLWLP